MKKLTKIGGVAAVAVALVLSGCGQGGSTGPETAKGQQAGGDLSKLVSINAKDAKDLEPGGTLTLPVGTLGPGFNVFARSGNSTDNQSLHRPIDGAATWGCWNFDFDGTATPNKDFCEDVKSEVKDGKQTVTIKVNQKASYNDGTPIDVKTFENTWKMLNGKNKDINIVLPGAYEFVDSVKAGANDKEVIVTTTQPVYPLSSLFAGLVHPAVNTPEVFNNGFVGELHPEWMAGPFKVDKYDSTEKTLTLSQNDKWWGTKPVLNKVVFRQLEPSAQIAAFKNGEIDAISANTISVYSQLDGTKDSEVRRGQRLFSGGLILNAVKAPLNDTAVRQAIFTAMDRTALRNVRFKGLNWEEPSSGSLLVLPFSKYYQDNYPVKDSGTDPAKKVLTDAGYKLNDKGIMEKDGVPVSFKITNFGDDPTALATAQTLQQQLQKAGLDVGIDQRSLADFGKTMGTQDYNVTLSGFGLTSADATDGVKQFYQSKTNDNGLGDAELDEAIQKLSSIADDTERNKAALDVEKKHMAKYYSMAPVFNGPQISFVHTGLANYGPSLFKSLAQVPDWTTVGWEKGKQKK